MGLMTLSVHRICVFSLLGIALTLPRHTGAQEFRAMLAGRVVDTTGATVAGARIEVRNADTAQSSATLSGDDGSYQVSFLTPGNYVIAVEKPGFKRAVRAGVTLQVARRAVVDFQLALGDVTQSVTVTGGSEVIKTQSADRGLTRLEEPAMSNGRRRWAAAFSITRAESVCRRLVGARHVHDAIRV